MPDKPKSSAERKRAERERKRKAGLRPGEVWAHENDWPKIRAFVAELAERRERVRNPDCTHLSMLGNVAASIEVDEVAEEKFDEWFNAQRKESE